MVYIIPIGQVVEVVVLMVPQVVVTVVPWIIFMEMAQVVLILLSLGDDVGMIDIANNKVKLNSI